MKTTALMGAFIALAFGGCAGSVVTGPTLLGADAALIAGTRHWGGPPADTQSQIPEHESWCYSTLGDVQCYTKAQNVAPDRLVNVEPQNRYPLTPELYKDELAGVHYSSAASKSGDPAAQDAPAKKDGPWWNIFGVNPL